MTRVVVAGEALIDRVTRADGDVAEIPGGGPFNTARTLARQGVATSFVGRLSTDAAGRRLRADLAADGVDLTHVVTTDDPTTTAHASLDGSGGATYRFDLDGTSAAGLTLDDVLATGLRPEEIEVLHVGTLGLVLEPSGTAIEGLVDAVAASCLVMLDPNARPSATSDPGAHRARIARLAARADVIKVSVDDLRYLAADGDVETGLAGLLAAGGGPLVLVTDGAASVEIVTRSDRRRLPVPSVAVIDSVGAGDAFGGGFLAAWLDTGRGRDDLHDLEAVDVATRRAIVVAALTCTRPGADPPTRREVDAVRGSGHAR